MSKISTGTSSLCCLWRLEKVIRSHQWGQPSLEIPVIHVHWASVPPSASSWKHTLCVPCILWLVLILAVIKVSYTHIHYARCLIIKNELNCTFIIIIQDQPNKYIKIWLSVTDLFSAPPWKSKSVPERVFNGSLTSEGVWRPSCWSQGSSPSAAAPDASPAGPPGNKILPNQRGRKHNLGPEPLIVWSKNSQPSGTPDYT